MQARFKWFRIKFPAKSKNLAMLIASHPFNNKTSYGFASLLDSSSGASYRFLWRSRVVVTKLDSEGLPSYEQIESVSFTDFELVDIEDLTFLRVENPGRNIRELLNALEALIGIGFTVKPITFGKARPITIFESVDAFKLVGLKIVGAVVADDLVARMEFVSRSGMVIENMNVLNGLRYEVEHAAFEIFIEGLKGQVSFAANGTVKISGQIAPKVISLVEADLHLFV